MLSVLNYCFFSFWHFVSIITVTQFRFITFFRFHINSLRRWWQFFYLVSSKILVPTSLSQSAYLHSFQYLLIAGDYFLDSSFCFFLSSESFCTLQFINFFQLSLELLKSFKIFLFVLINFFSSDFSIFFYESWLRVSCWQNHWCWEDHWNL